MAQFADLLALSYDPNGTRHAFETRSLVNLVPLCEAFGAGIPVTSVRVLNCEA